MLWDQVMTWSGRRAIWSAAGVLLVELRQAEGKMRLSRRINFTRSQTPPGLWENVSKRVVSPEKSLCKNNPVLFTSYAVSFCQFPRVNPRKQPFQADCMVSADRVVRVTYIMLNRTKI